MEAVHVVGAGGIGCAVGYALCSSGIAVTFVDADNDKVAWGRRHGVAVDRLPPRPSTFLTFAEWQPPSDATVLLCTKCYDNAAVLARLPASTRLIPIQNGFDPLLQTRAHAVEGIASIGPLKRRRRISLTWSRSCSSAPAMNCSTSSTTRSIARRSIISPGRRTGGASSGSSRLGMQSR